MRASGFTLVTLLAVLTGLFLGVGVYTFGYAKGASYMTDNAAACANCHVMQDQYSSWRKSSHHNVAVCNDCHTPPGFVPKYYTKALNGFFHSLAFTTGHFPDEIQITGRNHKVAEASCMKCHSEITQQLQGVRGHASGVSCTQCHAQVGHQ